MSLLDCVEINPARQADKSIIWLHGLGANGHDFEPIVPQLNLPANHQIRFVFPHAPQRPVTINNGYVMPAWFDITTLERLNGVDRQGIDESVEQVTALIEREQQRGVELQNIVIAGFSQGGVIALHTSLSLPNSLAGIIALSTYLPFAEEISVTKCETPVFMAHGLFDPVISVMLGKHSYDKILPHYVNAEWHEYPMEHSICAQEIDAISQWLHKLPDFVGEYA